MAGILSNNKKNIINFFINKKILNNFKTSDLLLPNSIQTKNEAIKCNISKDKIIVVPHAIDDKIIYDQKNIFSKNKFIVGYLGSIHERKNIKFAIDAFKLIKNKNIEFRIYGKFLHGYEKNFFNYIKDDKRIKYCGFASENKKSRIYDSFDVFLFPSNYEGFGLPILEAQARGLPVIIKFDAKISPEISKYSFKAKDIEHMKDIIENIYKNGYKSKICKKAMIYAKTFNWKNTAIKTMNAYLKII